MRMHEGFVQHRHRGLIEACKWPFDDSKLGVCCFNCGRCCFRNFNSQSTITPKSFSACVCWSFSPLILYRVNGFDFPTFRILHFPVLKGSCHSSDHFVSFAISSWRTGLSCLTFTLLKILASSANNLHILTTVSGISLIKTTNRVGPKIDHCGIPLITSSYSEYLPSTWTCWFLSLRNSLIQFKADPLIPNCSNLMRSLEWGTLSKAFEKSV